MELPPAIWACPSSYISTYFNSVTETAGRLPGPRNSSALRNSWQQTLEPEILELERTTQCFEMIEQDPCLSYRLPPKKCLAGRIMRHCFETVESVIERHQPLIFKVGYTHCAHARYYNSKFGYVHNKDKWEHLLVLYAAGETTSPAFVEAALIQHFKGHWDWRLIQFFLVVPRIKGIVLWFWR